MEIKKDRKHFIKKLTDKGFSRNGVDLAMFAYDLSKSAHRVKNRDSGERYFEHPREMIYILLDEIGSKDINEVIILLLHDTLEDTAIFGSVKDSWQLLMQTATFRLERSFNQVVAKGVITFTKPEIDLIYFKDKTEVTQYYLQGLIEQPDIFLLKMIDRLHNLRSLIRTDLTKIAKQVKETEEILLPLFETSMLKISGPTKRWDIVKKLIHNELIVLNALL